MHPLVLASSWARCRLHLCSKLSGLCQEEGSRFRCHPGINRPSQRSHDTCTSCVCSMAGQGCASMRLCLALALQHCRLYTPPGTPERHHRGRASANSRVPGQEQHQRRALRRRHALGASAKGRSGAAPGRPAGGCSQGRCSACHGGFRQGALLH